MSLLISAGRVSQEDTIEDAPPGNGVSPVPAELDVSEDRTVWGHTPLLREVLNKASVVEEKGIGYQDTEKGGPSPQGLEQRLSASCLYPHRGSSHHTGAPSQQAKSHSMVSCRIQSMFPKMDMMQLDESLF